MLNTSFSPWPCFDEEEIEAVRKVMLSNKVNYWTGEECRNFEKEFALFADTRYAVALANGSLGLDAALKSLDIGPGDEVIVTSRSYIASVSSIIIAGATPIFVDLDLSSQNISPKSIRSAISKHTKAILCVHLAGWPCEMDEIMTIANEFNLYVVEDCAQAHGAKYNGKSVGSIGHVASWSFCQDKIISTGGEGGMITTNDETIWHKIWSYKDHGKSLKAIYDQKDSNGFKWVHESFGTNWRMTEMQAAIGRIQLKKMPYWQKIRINNAKKIWNTARECKGFRVPIIPNNIEHAAYKCYIFVKGNLQTRNKILTQINEKDVPCYIGSCPEVYLEKAFNNTKFKPKKRLQNTKILGDTSLMFLVHPTLTKEEIQKTCYVLKEVANENFNN